MKKKCLWLCMLVAITLLSANYARAQKDTTRWMLMNEYRVHDESVVQKNYPILRAWYLKADADIEVNRIAHTSESGRIYGLTFFKGPENFGTFMGTRVRLGDEFAAKEPAIVNENAKNANGPILRSTWIMRDSISTFEPGFKIENFDFRKLQFITVTADKTREFEAAVYKRLQIDAAHGIHYNSAVFKCVDGYPNNTYALFLPDKSMLDYYKNRDVRMSKRDAAKNDYGTLQKTLSDLGTVNRIDHLFRVK